MNEPADNSNESGQQAFSCSYTRSCAILFLFIFFPMIILMPVADGCIAYCQNELDIHLGNWEPVVHFLVVFVLLLIVLAAFGFVCVFMERFQQRTNDEP